MAESDFEKEFEIVGGLKNALTRGESLESARISFLNAGYSPQVVNMAVRRIMGQSVNTVVEHQIPQRNIQIPQSNIIIPQRNLPLYASKTNQIYPGTVYPSRVNNFQQQNFQGSYPVANQKRVFNVIPYWAVILMILLSMAIIIGASVLGIFWEQIFKL